MFVFSKKSREAQLFLLVSVARAVSSFPFTIIMTYRRSLQKSLSDNTQIFECFFDRKLNSIEMERRNKRIEIRLARHHIPLSELSAVSLALYPPEQQPSTECVLVLHKYKLPAPNITLRIDFTSPSAPHASNIRLHGFIFGTVCPIQFGGRGIFQISMFKPEHSVALIRYIYTREVSPIVVSLLGVTRLIEEKDLKQPRIPTADWNPIVLLMMQTKTERELDEVGVGIEEFCWAVGSLSMRWEDIWDALNLAWRLLLCAHPDGRRRTMKNWPRR
ncbi:uncharacterized protein EV420DRAFT_211540 [Desarmillaria tabescens]|uniref:Uncharacterized protein n=1 Tax=Armillaria tabescens TaxID=1929756 RepID=A0AA39TQF7_ARMTA|nr:uncharacterized protein EV420DRAFT_211540 [Desarmillaria tabescens]KAK0460454.1 hypothetical protein EV420DRAFT_211540 [Desarmillaria tabescens]